MTDAPKSGEPPFSHGPGREPTIQVVRDLGRPGSAPRQLDPEVEYDSALRAVSPSGQRLLLESWRGKQVVDVEAGRRLTSVDDPEHWTRAAFLSESTIRALRTNRRPAATPPKGDLANQLGVPLARALGAREWNADARAAYPLGQATVVDWDLESGQLTERGTIAIQGARSLYAGLTPTEDWQRLLRLDGSGLYVHDLDGRVVATLVDGWGARTNRAAGPFSGGRVGCVEEGPSRLRLRVFDSEGRIVSDAWLEGRFPLRVGGELAPGVLSLGVSDEGEPATLIVDLLTGSVVRRERGLSPALRLWEAGIGLAAAVPEPGSLGTRVFVGDDGLVSLDPGTGARSVLVARRSRIEER